VENPLQLCADLKAIFRRHSGGWLDRDTLRRVRQLCHRAGAAAHDPHARVEIGKVAHYAEQLYSHRDARTDSLREHILLTLDSLEDRLYADWNSFRKPASDSRINQRAGLTN
jgi:hypothetical protein